jgi:hypothetical protein
LCRSKTALARASTSSDSGSQCTSPSNGVVESRDRDKMVSLRLMHSNNCALTSSQKNWLKPQQAVSRRENLLRVAPSPRQPAQPSPPGLHVVPTGPLPRCGWWGLPALQAVGRPIKCRPTKPAPEPVGDGAQDRASRGATRAKPGGSPRPLHRVLRRPAGVQGRRKSWRSRPPGGGYTGRPRSEQSQVYYPWDCGVGCGRSPVSELG